MAINWEAPIEIRDGRNGNWFWVDKQVWEHAKLTSSDKVVYGTLAYFANQKTQQAFPQMKTLEAHCKLSRRQVYRSTKALEIFKFIHIKRQRGLPNLYTLIDNWKKLQGNDKLSVVTGSPITSDSMSHGLVTNNTSNNNIKTNNKNNKTLTKVNGDFGNPQINEGIKLLTSFFGYSPSRLKLNRYTLKRLIKSKGYERVLKAMKFSLSQQLNRYAPKITSYMDLEQKWSDLEVYARREIMTPRKGGVIDATSL